MAKKTTTKKATAPKKATPAKKAVAPKKAAPAKKAVAPKKAAPAKKAVAPKKATPAKKAVAPKKAAPSKKAVAPKKAAPAKKAVAPKNAAPAKKAAAATSIIARVDVGFGNALYVRGEGAGLSWNKGTALENTTPYEWTLISTKKGNVTFKFLINDELWAEGENITIEAGGESNSSPIFAW
ncbi:MAG: outer membrane biosynthesis protein TonB [Lentimonas sp.]|jgi:outer membrane biosynthesis protein TonB